MHVHWCFSLAGYHFDQMRNGLMYHDSRELDLRHGVNMIPDL